MADHLPLKWIADGPRPELAGEAARGEFFAFQVGLYAVATNIQDISVRFSDLRASNGGRGIPSSAFRCFNTGGTNWSGAAFSKAVSVAEGTGPGALVWRPGPQGPCAGNVPRPRHDQASRYAGAIGQACPNSHQHRLSPIPGMMSQRGTHDCAGWIPRSPLTMSVVRPFTPIQVTGDTLEILGRRMALGPSGIPAQISSYYSPEVTHIQEPPKSLLTAPLELIVEDSAGRRLEWRKGAPKFTKQTGGIVEWRASSTAGPLRMEVRGALECDGFAQFKVTVSSSKPVEVRDIRLEIPLAKEAAKYMMGLGFKGGRRPASLRVGLGREEGPGQRLAGRCRRGPAIQAQG